MIGLYEAILQINPPLPHAEKPSELLRRLLEVRAYSTRPPKPGERPRRKQTEPISPTRVKKVHAVLLSALNWVVKSKRLRENPIEQMQPPRIRDGG
ncbi:hypothetical protein [Actinomadura sp. WMMB 499]|uniref:hypothetical protein n=1 Tax=Actinomadura sp. WMMB 499 TaxID=1219491 RepID=UPI0012486F67|nr:hypothetical protein [Actinomadura sp. WMMB 499]QFG22916.1 hypothetical protein F7P10_19140 [Actinomadura sp. WMMB 499]